MKNTMYNTNNINNILDVQGRVTTDFWPTEQVKLIEMNDGSFALGVNVQYTNKNGDLCYETCRIQLDEDNVPYVELGADQGFSEENCKSKISYIKYTDSTGFNRTVEGLPIMTLDDGVNVCEKSVFKFVGDSVTEPTIRKYFSGYYREAWLNQKGIELVYKFVTSEENKSILAERVRKPNEVELAGMQKELKDAMDGFLNGVVDEYQLKRMVDAYNLITKSYGMNPEGVIECDLTVLDKALTKPQGQPE